MAKKAMILKQQKAQKYSTREYNRCKICGRPHAYLRKYGICRICFRDTVSDEPAKAPHVRKFMNYYLPTTLKVLANYRLMQQRGVSYQDMSQARDSAVRCMNMVLTACQKQIDALHKENMLDISTRKTCSIFPRILM